MNREQYLNIAVNELRPLFKDAGHNIPTIRVSIGFMGGRSSKKAIGQYWHDGVISDGIAQIYISPVIKDTLTMLDVLVHELVHACVGAKAGHGPVFKKLALAVGLTGKMRSTVAGPQLTDRLNAIIKKLGNIDHGSIDLSERKKQGTRMIKLECPQCQCVVRTSQKWIDTYQFFNCPCGEEMEIK